MEDIVEDLDISIGDIEGIAQLAAKNMHKLRAQLIDQAKYIDELKADVNYAEADVDRLVKQLELYQAFTNDNHDLFTAWQVANRMEKS